MKAIITKINPNSAFSQYIGFTFNVETLEPKLIVLDVDGLRTSFEFTGVMIVDLEKEYQKSFDDYNWGTEQKTYIALKKYIKENNFLIKEPTYNCPA